MISGLLYAQGEKNKDTVKKWCLDSVEVLQVSKDYAKLEMYEENYPKQEEQIVTLQKSLKAKDSSLNHQTLMLKDRDEQIELFKQREAMVELVPALRWDGFHLGLGARYDFDGQVITQQTVIAGMKYEVTGTARVVILGKITGELKAGIPLNKEKFYLKVEGSYRIF